LKKIAVGGLDCACASVGTWPRGERGGSSRADQCSAPSLIISTRTGPRSARASSYGYSPPRSQHASAPHWLLWLSLLGDRLAVTTPGAGVSDAGNRATRWTRRPASAPEVPTEARPHAAATAATSGPGASNATATSAANTRSGRRSRMKDSRPVWRCRPAGTALASSVGVVDPGAKSRVVGLGALPRSLPLEGSTVAPQWWRPRPLRSGPRHSAGLSSLGPTSGRTGLNATDLACSLDPVLSVRPEAAGRGVDLGQAGRSQAEVAHQLGVSRQNVSRWTARWLSGGSEALRSRLMTWIGVRSNPGPAAEVRSRSRA
jgi:Helix-turn-helix domain